MYEESPAGALVSICGSMIPSGVYVASCNGVLVDSLGLPLGGFGTPNAEQVGSTPTGPASFFETKNRGNVLQPIILK